MKADCRERYFDKAAHTWHKRQQLDGAGAARMRYVEKALAHAPRTILDVACGTGILVPHITRRCPDAQLVELDSSAEMLTENRLRHNGAAREFVCARFQEWQSPRLFDAVLCFNALPHLGATAPAMARMAALLAPGGRLAVGHSMCSRQLNAMHAAKRQVSNDVALRAREIAPLLRDSLRLLEVEESPGWYFVLGERAC